MEVSDQLHAISALLPRKTPGTHWIGGWVSAKGWSGRGGKEKISLPLPVIEIRSSNP